MDKPKRIVFTMKPEIYIKLKAIQKEDDRSIQKIIERLINKHQIKDGKKNE